MHPGGWTPTCGGAQGLGDVLSKPTPSRPTEGSRGEGQGPCTQPGHLALCQLTESSGERERDVQAGVGELTGHMGDEPETRSIPVPGFYGDLPWGVRMLSYTARVPPSVPGALILLLQGDSSQLSSSTGAAGKNVAHGFS